MAERVNLSLFGPFLFEYDDDGEIKRHEFISNINDEIKKSDFESNDFISKNKVYYILAYKRIYKGTYYLQDVSGEGQWISAENLNKMNLTSETFTKTVSTLRDWCHQIYVATGVQIQITLTDNSTVTLRATGLESYKSSGRDAFENTYEFTDDKRKRLASSYSRIDKGPWVLQDQKNLYYIPFNKINIVSDTSELFDHVEAFSGYSGRQILNDEKRISAEKFIIQNMAGVYKGLDKTLLSKIKAMRKQIVLKEWESCFDTAVEQIRQQQSTSPDTSSYKFQLRL